MNSQASKRPLILIADNDRHTRIGLRSMLEQDGYRITEARNGVQCMSVIAQHQPSMVLLDVNLSNMDGLTCCAEIKKLPKSDQTPVILLSKSENPEFIEDAFRAGATDYITKPIQLSILRQRLRYLLKAHQSELTLRESEARYRLVVDTLKEVVFQTDPQGQFTFLNSAWLDMTGFCQTESLGHNIIEYIYPEDRPTFAQAFKALFQGQRNECLLQVRYLTQSNQLKWMEIYAQSVKAVDGSLISLSGSLNNITERRGREQRQKLEQAITIVLAESVTLGDALPNLLRMICQSLGWDYGELWLTETQVEMPTCIETWSRSSIEALRLPPKLPYFALAAEFIQRIWEYDWPVSLSRINSPAASSRASEAGMSSAFSLPIMGGYYRLGVMVFFVRDAEVLNANVLKRMSSLGSQIGEFWMRKQAEAEVKRQNSMLQSELNEAADYVRSLMPSPINGPVTIQHQFVPSNQLGGDAFDYYWLDDEHIVVYLLDVAGHGVRSTLLSVSVLNVLRSRSLPATDFYQPQSVLEGLNQRFQMNEQGDDYFTIWYGVYNPIKQTLIYASAGHPPAILLTSNTSQLLSSGGPPIGLLPELNYSQDSLSIEPEQSLYLFSDGVYEILQPNGTIWGFQNFLDLVIANHSTLLDDIGQLFKHIQNIQGNAQLDDDYSILQLRFIPENTDPSDRRRLR